MNQTQNTAIAESMLQTQNSAIAGSRLQPMSLISLMTCDWPARLDSPIVAKDFN